ncbi:MAG: hypothetical protein ACRDP9_11840 [Kribbellaceae bacterium]
MVTPYTDDLTAGPRVYLAEAGLTANQVTMGAAIRLAGRAAVGAGQRLMASV